MQKQQQIKSAVANLANAGIQYAAQARTAQEAAGYMQAMAFESKPRLSQVEEQVKALECNAERLARALVALGDKLHPVLCSDAAQEDAKKQNAPLAPVAPLAHRIRVLNEQLADSATGLERMAAAVEL